MFASPVQLLGYQVLLIATAVNVPTLVPRYGVSLGLVRLDMQGVFTESRKTLNSDRPHKSPV
jgi:hypothetical protein